MAPRHDSMMDVDRSAAVDSSVQSGAVAAGATADEILCRTVNAVRAAGAREGQPLSDRGKGADA